MTGEAFAGLVDAKRTGAGKWLAHCPAHSDSSPSLSIREGTDGRVLLYCFAGCRLDAILTALRLCPRDLFAGPLPSPEQAAASRQASAERERIEREDREAQRKAWDDVRKWEAIVNALGRKLAGAPDDESLVRLFHDACDRLHKSETKAEEMKTRPKHERAS